jgi:hypothetical protein
MRSASADVTPGRAPPSTSTCVPLRRVLALVLKHHPLRTLPNLRRIPPTPICHLAHLSSDPASNIPGAIQFFTGSNRRLWTIATIG